MKYFIWKLRQIMAGDSLTEIEFMSTHLEDYLARSKTIVRTSNLQKSYEALAKKLDKLEEEKARIQREMAEIARKIGQQEIK